MSLLPIPSELNYYLLPTTYYLLPTTYYLLPSIYYLLPATCYLLPITWHQRLMLRGFLRSVALQDVSGGNPVAVDGTDGNLWGMQVDLEAAKEEIRNLTVRRHLHLLNFYRSRFGWHLNAKLLEEP